MASGWDGVTINTLPNARKHRFGQFVQAELSVENQLARLRYLFVGIYLSGAVEVANEVRSEISEILAYVLIPGALQVAQYPAISWATSSGVST